MSKYEKGLTARDALVLSIPEAGFGNERANVALQNLAKVGWQIVPLHHSPGPFGYSPDEFIKTPTLAVANVNPRNINW